MKAAYIPVGAGGHILSSLPMVTELVKRGVEVDYYAPESFREQVEFTGARLCVFPEVTECYSNPYMGREEFLAVIPLVFLGQAKEKLDAVMTGLERNRPDVIISDALALAGRLAAWKLDIPLVMFFSSYAPGEDFSIFRTWPDYPGSPAREAAANMAEEFHRQYGGKLLTPAEIFEGTADLNICALSRSLQPGHFGDDFLFAGAQVAPRSGDDLWSPPANGKPLLYTSLGSLFNNWPDFYRMLFPAVKDLDINVLCSIGKSIRVEELGDVPENVALMRFTPQLEVLRHADFFITHAGTGSVMEAMYHGVPCLCLPQMEEQVFTAGRLKELGAASGVVMRQDANADSLREGILRLLSDTEAQKQAKRLSETVRAEGGCVRAAQAVIDFVSNRV